MICDLLPSHPRASEPARGLTAAILGVIAAWLALPLESAPAFEDFMGINGHTVQFRPKLYAPAARLVRDYHPVEWDLGKDSASVPPFPVARNGVNWEAVYGSWRKLGWRIDACLMFETLPRKEWKDLAADARAYAERFARAFGPSSPHPLVESVEIGNEPGKYSDADYRVVFENMARGFKAADPKLKVATCALTTGKSHDYAKSVDCLAGFEPFYDVLNVHSYPQLEGWPTWRRSFPEDPRLKEFTGDIRAVCRWRDQHAAGKEVWLTEFGYDASTRQPDPKTEFKQWTGVTDEQQARWLVRSWLLFASMPLDRAYLYFFNDADEPQVHGSAGLTRNFQPKPSFYAVSHLRKTLSAFRWSRNFDTGSARIAEFVQAEKGDRRIWVVWLPTGDNRRENVALPPFPGSIERIEAMPLGAGENRMVEMQGRSLPVTEAPIYIHFTGP